MLAKVTTLHEVEKAWSLTDLLDANEALDLQMAADASARKQMEDSCRAK